MGDEEWDVFISHASEDKASIVRPLADALRDSGLRVWYDDFTLKVGDSLRECIDFGLKNSRYGIVILSKHFFAKKWTNRELNALFQREETINKVILPIWHGLTREEVARYSPILADRVAVTTGKGLENVISSLLSVIQCTPDAISAKQADKFGKESDILLLDTSTQKRSERFSDVRKDSISHRVGLIRRFASGLNIGSVDFGPNGATALTAVCEEGLACILWDLSTGREICRIGEGYAWYKARYICGSNSVVIGCGQAGPPLEVRDIFDGKLIRRLKGKPGQLCIFEDIAVSPDGQFVCAVGSVETGMTYQGSGTPAIWLWELPSARLLNFFRACELPPIRVAIASEGKALLGTPNELLLVNAITGQVLVSFNYEIIPSLEAPVYVDISPNADRVLSCNRFERYPEKHEWDKFAHEILLWKIDGGQLERTLNDYNLTCGLFLPDGKRILSGSMHGDLCIWEAISGYPIMDFSDHIESVREINVSKDGRFALSFAGIEGEGDEVLLWGLPD
jgi:WD40 repeat protein